MYNGLKVCAVIAAAGKSRRMGLNKQFIEIQGIPVLARTLQSFDNMNLVDGIVLVAGEGDVEKYEKSIIYKYGICKVMEVVEGSTERQYSVMNGLNVLKGNCGIAIIHDGARPFVSGDIIDTSIRDAYAHGAAACAVPVKDTIKIAGPDGFVLETPDRARLYMVQTPQAFMFDILYKAHIRAFEQGYVGTDDTVLVERIGVKVKLFAGSYENIKITTPEDIYIAEAIIRDRRSGDV